MLKKQEMKISAFTMQFLILYCTVYGLQKDVFTSLHVSGVLSINVLEL
uniref:Uncharacterized protein n=1 Tax=Anguilla anguilla TaxID=7936 RepID=A0A0E9UQZ5_ANGAN